MYAELVPKGYEAVSNPKEEELQALNKFKDM